LREVFSTPDIRIILKASPDEASTALEHGAFDIVVIYADTGEDTLSRNLRRVRGAQPEVFVLVLAPEYSSSGETTAFDAGADFYFAEPFPAQSLLRLISNCNRKPTRPERQPKVAPESSQKTTSDDASSTLHTLRDLSHILCYSLDYKAFTQHFILKLRDHISFSRIGIFLENSAKQSLIKKTGTNHLECIASIGLPSDLVDCFQLSRITGIGRELSEEPRVLHRQGSRHAALPGQSESAVDKEFAILGCHTAIPISDREGSIGIAVMNGPITGREYSEDELELLYILMEELGLAIRNSRLHGELAQHGQLIENVLHSMSSGALVCGEDLQVLYANDPAKRFLGIESPGRNREIDFAELPPQLAGPIHRAVEKGELTEPFFITGPSEGYTFRVSIFPFTQKGELVLLPRPTMIIIEDFTKIEATKKNAVDATKDEVIRLIAERFAHEIRNSLVPLTTHAQLIDKKIAQPEFQASLKKALTTETARIKRFSEQMLYMAQSSNTGSREIQLADLVESAFDRARSNATGTKARLRFENQAESSMIQANPEALTYALEEIFLNSMQAESGEQEIHVTLEDNNEGILCLQIKDDGPGIPEDILEHATDAFYTTRNTGIGLGLSVASKIISEHNGYLRLYPRNSEKTCDLEIELTLLLTSATL
jgi:nitrogen-specific signal transduction histidine kinase